MTLKELIERLEKEPNKFLKLGFTHAHSWRGSYSELAFEPCEGAKVSDMLYEAKEALGKTFEGWKGGDFVMTENTEVYLSEEGVCGSFPDDSLSLRLLEYMLKDELPKLTAAYRLIHAQEAICGLKDHHNNPCTCTTIGQSSEEELEINMTGKIFPMNTIQANRLDIEKLRDEFAAEFIRLDKFRVVAGQLADVLRHLRKSAQFGFDEDRKIILKDTIEALDAYDEIARDDHTCKWSVGGCDQ